MTDENAEFEALLTAAFGDDLPATPDDDQALKDDSPCPGCGEQGIWREEVDVGVGIICGPYGCSCGWSEAPEYDAHETEPEAPSGWRVTPQGVLVNLEREAQELTDMKFKALARFGGGGDT